MYKKRLGLFLSTIICTHCAAHNASAEENYYDGFKVGVHGGIIFTEGKFSVLVKKATGLEFPVNGDKSGKGCGGGVHFGFDKVLENNILVGVVAFADYGGAEGKITDPNANGNTVAGKADLAWTIGLMARLGYVINKTLIYGGVGIIGTDWKIKAVADSTNAIPVNGVNGSVNDFTRTKLLGGFRFTAGIDTKLTERLIIGLESNYSVYKSIRVEGTFNDIVTGFGPGARIRAKHAPDVLDVKVKFSYKI